MKKSLFRLIAGLLLVLTALAPVGAQHFHRPNHANRSQTLKAEHSSQNVRHRVKHRIKKARPGKDERRRRREAKRQQKRRDEGGSIPAKATAF